MTIEEPRLLSALSEGPMAAAAEIDRILSGQAIEESQPAMTVEWISDLYSTELSEPQRACLRDATLFLLESRQPDGTDDSAMRFVRILGLARHLQLLTTGPARMDDRLWNAAYSHLRDGDARGAAHLIGYLAEEGKSKSVERWTEVVDTFGLPVFLGATVGVARHGLLAALEWVSRNIAPSSWSEILVALLPAWVATDGNAVSDFLRTTDNDPFAAEVTAWAQELGVGAGIGVLTAEQVPSFADARALSEYAARTFAELVDPTNQSSPDEAALRYEDVDDDADIYADAMRSRGLDFGESNDG